MWEITGLINPIVSLPFYFLLGRIRAAFALALGMCLARVSHLAILLGAAPSHDLRSWLRPSS
ncbi:hypothetical protein B0H16DRAFT_239727 [Mycena metata]|uniref:Uncharacterized protein n=1 Tax=Mycena metata TaxID=1033252 RepID=A0AAD7MQP5_9AGAR|nr:hypothetical protein B0H16DRAFT_239727 [Mycena metata]